MNIKSKRKIKRYSLGTFDLDRSDLINLEKIILKRIKPLDYYINVGKPKYITVIPYWIHVYSRVKGIPRTTRKYHYLEIISKVPNISVTFKSHSTEIIVPRMYYKDEKLGKVDEIGRELDKYLNSKKLNHNDGLINKIIHKNNLTLT